MIQYSTQGEVLSTRVFWQRLVLYYFLMQSDEKDVQGAWGPLRSGLFRALWLTNVVSLVGSWMHDVGASWLMTSLAPSPFMVAMVQTATTLPFCLLALPAGALADMIDRRRLLIVTQIWMLVASVLLGVLTILGLTSPVVLLLFTFLLSLGASINLPAWQAVIPEMVPREQLPAAVTLNSVAFNIARCLGPALGGFVVGMVGPGFTFLLNGVSYTGVVAVLKRWKREVKDHTLPEERLIGAMRIGVRYVRNAPEVRSVLVHAGLFSVFGVSLWAFLPIVARQYLGLSSLGYGMLFGLFGTGGILGATLLQRLRDTFSLNTLVAASTILFAATILSLGYAHSVPVLAFAMVVGGAAWLILLSILNTVVQAVIPAWVRGRVLSVYMLVFFGGMAGGSAFWGSLAHAVGIPGALAISAACLVLQIPVTFVYKLSTGKGLDLRPSLHWPSPLAEGVPEPEEGPVLVVVEYRIDPARAKEFTEAMGGLKAIRLRDGAIRWNLFRNLPGQGTYIESFITESWAEHMRQHDRFTVSDREIEKKAFSFHIGSRPPKVMHFIAEPVRRR